MASIKHIALLLLSIFLAVSLNCQSSVVATNLNMPLYLDSLLTIAITAIFGLYSGIAVALLSNATLFFFGYSMPLFIFCHILTAVFAHVTFLYYRKKEEEKDLSAEIFLWAGLWSAFANGFFGNIISQVLYSFTENPKVDNMVQGIYIATKSLTFATHFVGYITNLIDKMISAILSFFVYKIVTLIKSHFSL